MSSRRLGGFTLIEMMVVVALLGVLAALAVPALVQVQANSRLRGTSREVSNLFQAARARAISTGNNQIVYLTAPGAMTGGVVAGQDACGNPLPNDLNGNPPVAVIIDESVNANCCLDANEQTTVIGALPGVNWGVTLLAPAVVPVPQDAGPGVHTTGATFGNNGGAQAGWVMFRPDGVPVGFSPACAQGQVGSGAGGVYFNNTERDYAVVLSPLGGVKTYSYDRSNAVWTN